MSKGTKYDQEKIRIDLVPGSAVLSMARALTHGAEKYGDRNWEKGIEFSRLFAALQRHLIAWYNIKEIDKESGLNHLDHALCNLAMLNEMQYRHPEMDDRPPKQEWLEEFMEENVIDREGVESISEFDAQNYGMNELRDYVVNGKGETE